MNYEFLLTGATPILFHRDNIEGAEVVKEWQKDPANRSVSVAGDDRSPAWTWKNCLYFDGDGRVTMPGENLMAALRYAGAKVQGKGRETFKGMSQSGLLLRDEFLDFAGPKGVVTAEQIAKLHDQPFREHAEAVKPLGFTLFMKRAVIGQAKHVRIRPRFESWTVRGQIEVIEQAITPQVLEMLFTIAGDRAGLGDWRPSAKKSPGPFGRFTATLKKV